MLNRPKSVDPTLELNCHKSGRPDLWWRFGPRNVANPADWPKGSVIPIYARQVQDPILIGSAGGIHEIERLAGARLGRGALQAAAKAARGSRPGHGRIRRRTARRRGE